MRLLQVAIVLGCALLLAGCPKQGAAPATRTLGQFLAGNADQVDTATLVARTGASLDVAQQVKADVQSNRSGLIAQLSKYWGSVTPEEHQTALKAACLVSDSHQFLTAKSDTDRQFIAMSQGGAPQHLAAGVVSAAKDLATMKNGTDAQKVAASIACLVGTNVPAR